MLGAQWLVARSWLAVALGSAVGCGDHDVGLHLTVTIPGAARPALDEVIVNIEAQGGLPVAASDTVSQGVAVHAGDGSLQLVLRPSALGARESVPLLLVPSGAHSVDVALRAWMFDGAHQVIGASPFVVAALGSDRSSTARLALSCATDSSCTPGTPASILDLATPNDAPLGIALEVAAGGSHFGLLGTGHFRAGPTRDLVVTLTDASGTRALIVRAPDWTPAAFPLLNKHRSLDLGTPAVTIVARPDAPFADIAAVGDLDGDGLDELALGAPTAGAGAGAVYVFSGAELARDGARIDLADAETYARIGHVLGAAPQDQLGSAIAIGAVRAPGVNDLVLGAPGAAGSTGPVAGRVYVLGLPSQESVAGAAGQSSTIYGSAPGTPIGGVIAIGDLDGDGSAELVLGSPTDGGQQRGMVRVLRGPRMQPGMVDLARTAPDGLILGVEGALLGSTVVIAVDGATRQLVAGAPGRDRVYAIDGALVFGDRRVEAGGPYARFDGLPGSRFGSAIARVSMADGSAGLAIAAPRANLGDRLRAGACFVFADEDRGSPGTAAVVVSIDGAGPRLVIYGAAMDATLGRQLSSGIFDAAAATGVLLIGAATDGDGHLVVYALRGP